MQYLVSKRSKYREAITDVLDTYREVRQLCLKAPVVVTKDRYSDDHYIIYRFETEEPSHFSLGGDDPMAFFNVVDHEILEHVNRIYGAKIRVKTLKNVYEFLV